MNDIEREAFERGFPIPNGVYWNANFGSYMALNRGHGLADAYQGRWETWQAARAQQARGVTHATGFAGGMPEGWKLVPEISTSEMDLAAVDYIEQTCLIDNFGRLEAEQVYQVMLTAAPSPEQGQSAPESGWILCSERLPKNGQKVKLKRSGEVIPYSPSFCFNAGKVFWDFDDYDGNPDILPSDKWRPNPTEEDENV